MGEKEEPKIGNQQKNKKDSKSIEEKGKVYDENEFLQGDLQIKFNEFDSQKGSLSPRMLFEKGKMKIHLYILKKIKTGKIYWVLLLKKKQK